MVQFENAQKFGKDAFDAALRSFGAVSTGAQTAVAETTDFAKRSVEQGTHVAEKLMGARTFDAAVSIQGDYLRSSYERLVAQTTKMGELAASTAREAFAPVESLVGKPFSNA